MCVRFGSSLLMPHSITMATGGLYAGSPLRVWGSHGVPFHSCLAGADWSTCQSADPPPASLPCWFGLCVDGALGVLTV